MDSDETRREAETRRYDLITNYRCGSSIEEMEPSDDGEWARWDDVLVLHDRLVTERNDLDKRRIAEISRLAARVQELEADNVNLQKSAEAWKLFQRVGEEHDPSKHKNHCARFQQEDDIVIAAFCGNVYDPRTDCTCGTDPSKAALKARVAELEAERDKILEHQRKTTDAWAKAEARVAEREALSASGLTWKEVAKRLDLDLAVQLRRIGELEREVARLRTERDEARRQYRPIYGERS